MEFYPGQYGFMEDGIEDASNVRDQGFVGFADAQRVAAGRLPDVAIASSRARQTDPAATMLVFDRGSGQVIDLDLRGSEHDIIARLGAHEVRPARRGRPRLGVVAREVTLLPRHWEWLAQQPGGASITLRRLVETARKSNEAGNGTRARNEAAYRFMAAIAGDLPGFEEAARALFAEDRAELERRTLAWPSDIHEEVLRFVDGAPAKDGL